MKITILFSKFFQNIHQTVSIVTCFQKFPHSKRVSKIFIFYIKNDNFWKILKTKSDPNTHQNAPNCTILKKILGGYAPEPP